MLNINSVNKNIFIPLVIVVIVYLLWKNKKIFKFDVENKLLDTDDSLCDITDTFDLDMYDVNDSSDSTNVLKDLPKYNIDPSFIELPEQQIDDRFNNVDTLQDAWGIDETKVNLKLGNSRVDSDNTANYVMSRGTYLSTNPSDNNKQRFDMTSDCNVLDKNQVYSNLYGIKY